MEIDAHASGIDKPALEVRGTTSNLTNRIPMFDEDTGLSNGAIGFGGDASSLGDGFGLGDGVPGLGGDGAQPDGDASSLKGGVVNPIYGSL